MNRVLFAFIFTAIALGQEASQDFLNQDPFLSDLYIKGPYLLYDCEGGHWVCTGEAEFNRCENWREDDRRRNKKNYRCANFNRYPSIAKCAEKQVSMEPARYPQRFCLTPAARKGLLHY